MSRGESVTSKIEGKGNELNRRIKLWGEIDVAYETGGEKAVEGVFTEHSDNITKEFEKLLKKIREKL